MINQVAIGGVVVDAPRVHTTQTGKTVTNMKIRVDEHAQGKVFSQFLPVSHWGPLLVAEGNYILANGKISRRSYDKDGVKVWVTEITAFSVTVFNQEPQPPGARRNPSDGYDGEQPSKPAASGSGNSYAGDDDIPF